MMHPFSYKVEICDQKNHSGVPSDPYLTDLSWGHLTAHLASGILPLHSEHLLKTLYSYRHTGEHSHKSFLQLSF